MRHAILLLSSLGKDYIESFIKENNFGNQEGIDIYIHLDKLSHSDWLYDKEHFLIEYNNIKLYDHKYHSQRFSIDMCDVMIWLLESAYKEGYDYYHFFSDSCRLVVPIQYFKKFFEKYNGYTFMHYDKYKNAIKENGHEIYKGSQWSSLHHTIVDKILKENLYDPIKRKCIDNEIQILIGAFDEVVFQYMVLYSICEDNQELIEKYKIKNYNLRFISFLNSNDHPRTLTIKNTKQVEGEMEEIIKPQYLMIRKYDYKRTDCYELLEYVKQHKQEEEL